jgi:small GTP-binding protein
MTSWPRNLPEREPEIKGTFRVALLGNSGAGKTCLLNNVTDGLFQDVLPPTIGIDLRYRTFSVGAGAGKDLYKLQIWDTAGRKEFRTISLSYIPSECLLVVFDVTSRESFEDATVGTHKHRHPFLH